MLPMYRRHISLKNRCRLRRSDKVTKTHVPVLCKLLPGFIRFDEYLILRVISIRSEKRQQDCIHYGLPMAGRLLIDLVKLLTACESFARLRLLRNAKKQPGNCWT